MATVIVTPTAIRNLVHITESHDLPEATLERFRASLAPLREFPRMGVVVPERTGNLRYILGPWRWMIILYRYLEDADQVWVVSMQDGRSARSPVGNRVGTPRHL